MSDLLVLREEDFSFVRRLLYDRFGISMGEQKRVLIAGRLSKRVRELGLGGFGEYFERLRADGSGEELSVLMNLLTTNHSYFYREAEHYRFLVANVIPGLGAGLSAAGRGDFRIWSAGCAAGEEVYTTAMVVRDALASLGAPALDASLLATDISTQALEAARQAVYPESRLRELPPRLRASYLVAVGEGNYAVAPSIREMVLFKRLNLMRGDFPFKGQFDLVFCRNVMIYFDAASRQRLIEAIHRVMKPGGYFFIGHSETIPKETCPFEYIKPAIYRKAG
jgi:chemotaxis protein methyltransferase CheR